jgi:DNA-binding LacI/PurR family transcriptional regulator
VSLETQRKVLDAISRLRYCPNPIAIELRQKRTQLSRRICHVDNPQNNVQMLFRNGAAEGEMAQVHSLETENERLRARILELQMDAERWRRLAKFLSDI